MQTAGRQYIIIMAKNSKKELSAQELAVVNAIKDSLENGYSLKSTTPQKKCIDGQARYTMWVENAEKQRFLVYLKDTKIKRIPEGLVNEMRKNNCLKTIK